VTVLNLFTKAKKRARQIFIEAITRRVVSFPPELSNIAKLDDALKCIDTRWPEDINAKEDTESPVFIFSAGWRSGSTLLQRLLCSSNELVIWGEPLGDAAVIPKMASSLSSLNSSWPPDEFFSHNLNLDSFSSTWIANVTPEISTLRSAHRAFYDQWLAQSARETYGVSKWGLKEVRLTIEHAKYLKWLYPNARFVFIYRNLFDAYRSWRGNMWGDKWPGYYTWSPIAYAKHWKLLLSGYLDGYEELGGYMVKYEDLIAGKIDLQALAGYVGVSHIDTTVLDKRIASPDKVKKRPKKWINPIARVLMNLTASRLLKELGYK
jgi:hypothetical protein